MESDGIIKAANMFLLLGDLEHGKNPDTEEKRLNKVNYEARIVFATMKNKIPGWKEPKDWKDLPLDQKEKRLADVREALSKPLEKGK